MRKHDQQTQALFLTLKRVVVRTLGIPADDLQRVAGGASHQGPTGRPTDRVKY